MTQMWVLWWPKDGAASTAACTSRNSTAAVSSINRESVSAPSPNCCGLGKFLMKLKRRSKLLMQRRRCISGGRISASTTQCHYDPHSYSLNFDDTSVSGNHLDQDYYPFHVFSSRYAAVNPGVGSCQRMQMGSSHSVGRRWWIYFKLLHIERCLAFRNGIIHQLNYYATTVILNSFQDLHVISNMKMKNWILLMILSKHDSNEAIVLCFDWILLFNLAPSYVNTLPLVDEWMTPVQSFCYYYYYYFE